MGHETQHAAVVSRGKDVLEQGKDGDSGQRYADSGIPAEAFEYRLGNRSALEWVIDQYQVSTDKRSGISSDPNGYSDDEKYIVSLVERVVQVSVETVAIVKGLPSLELGE